MTEFPLKWLDIKNVFVNAKQLKKRGYKLFQLLVFFSFVGDQMQTSTRPSLVTCNVNSLKAFETLIDENVTDIVFFIVC